MTKALRVAVIGAGYEEAIYQSSEMRRHVEL